MRPTMRFVAVKSEEKQAAAMVFKVRDLLVRQKTHIINAPRGLMAEFGITAPQGPSHVRVLINHIEDDSSSLPDAARAPCVVLVLTLRALIDKIREIGRRARHDDVAKGLGYHRNSQRKNGETDGVVAPRGLDRAKDRRS